MEDDKIKEILDEQAQQQAQQQKHQQKRTFWNNKKTVKGKALSVWLVVMVVIFMLFTFGIGVFLGKQLYETKKNNSGSSKDNTNTEVDKDKKENTNTNNNSLIHTSNVEKKDDFNIIYKQSYYQADFGLSMYVLEDGKSVKISFSPTTVNTMYQLNVGTEFFEKEISFDKKVVQLFFGGFGQGAGCETIFFLMEDGTIEYIPFYKELKKENWASLPLSEKMNSYGKIDGVTDVVRIYTLDITSGFSGYVSVGAARKDNSFYNLNEFLYNN